jgi:hypothetical protein
VSETPTDGRKNAGAEKATGHDERLKIGQSRQKPPPTVMSAINKSRHQPQPVSYMCNLFMPLLYTQLEDSQRNTIVYMGLVRVIVN